jgi:hypothetical protein
MWGIAPMLSRKVLSVLLGLGCCFSVASSGKLWAQQGPASLGGQPPSAPSTTGLEMPLTLRQKLVAGKTEPGTHVQANLVVATLVNGKVIPRNAVLSGEVIESKAKTQSESARLSVRMDSAQWSNGSVPIRVYLTSWFFPMTFDTGPNLQYGPEQSAKRTWNGMGEYPDPRSPGYKPFPASADTGSSPSLDTPASVISKNRVAMKGVQSQRDTEGVVTLVADRSNIKLDKLTTYVFASSDLAVASAK